MRVAIVAECFTPTWNGVTNSVLRILEHLERSGHQALVIAPGEGSDSASSHEVHRVASARLPLYRSMPVALPGPELHRRIRGALEAFRPDVVHLAAPVVLGDAGGIVAAQLGIPCVAAYQTDLAGFVRRYGIGTIGRASSSAVWSWLRRVHERAEFTLAPSSVAEWDLRRHGVTQVKRWARGVDTRRFNPRHRSPALRRRLVAPGRSVLVGYAGRLAPEKQLDDLQALRDLPGVQLVMIGDGPARMKLERRLKGAHFLGYLSGQALSEAIASLDVFVHPGHHETFCQAVQEAMASGVPVVAPAAGGPLDLVQHGTTGWLYPAGEPEVLREAVAGLAIDGPSRVRMAAASRNAVRNRTWQALCDQLLGYYRQVAGAEQPPERRAA